MESRACGTVRIARFLRAVVFYALSRPLIFRIHIQPCPRNYFWFIRLRRPLNAVAARFNEFFAIDCYKQSKRCKNQSAIHFSSENRTDMSKTKRVKNIADLAKIAGVNPATVSRAL